MKQKTDRHATWPKELFGLVAIFGKYPAILFVVISFFVFVYSIRTNAPDTGAHCVVYQVEHRQTPANCPDQFSNPKAKLILAILTDADESTRQRLASAAFGTNEDSWSRGIWKSIHEEMPSANRLQLYTQYANFYLATSTIEQYSAILKENSASRLNILSDYKNATQRYNAREKKTVFVWIISVIGIGFMTYLAFSVAGLVLCYKERRAQEENSVSVSEIALSILVPPIGLLILWMISYRLWVRDWIEYLRLRFMLGKDISVLYKEFRGISHRLKSIEVSSREKLETQLSELRRQIEQLISTRKRTKKLLGIPEHSPALDLAGRIQELRTRIDTSLAAEGEYQRTITPTDVQFAELERIESEQQPQAPVRT